MKLVFYKCPTPSKELEAEPQPLSLEGSLNVRAHKGIEDEELVIRTLQQFVPHWNHSFCVV